jgi:hypothetical protein
MTSAGRDLRNSACAFLSIFLLRNSGNYNSLNP